METEKNYSLEDIDKFLEDTFKGKGADGQYTLMYTEGRPFIEFDAEGKVFNVYLSLLCGPNTNMLEAKRLVNNILHWKNIKPVFRVEL